MKQLYFLLFLFSLSTTVFSQQAYYNDVDLELTGIDLRNELATKIIATHSKPLNYIWEASQNTDLDPSNSANVLLIYGWENGSDLDVTNDLYRGVNNNGGNVGDWNREHTFPNSLANPDLDDTGTNMTAYSDAHNLRASDVQRNSLRGNKMFASGSGNSSSVNSGTDWYPGDQWKGDVARVVMYMYLRYSTRCSPSLVAVGATNSVDANMIDLLLKWNAEDPVSTYEDNRNTYHDSGATYAQGNRNPFIDEPYLANMIWGIPVGQTAAEDRWNLLGTKDQAISSIKIYPNPVKNGFVYFSSTQDLDIIVYDILGKQVMIENITPNKDFINVSNLKKGIYLVKIKSENGQSTTKLIKQ